MRLTFFVISTGDIQRYCGMKQATREWVKKAEEDYLAGLDLARRRKVLLHNSVVSTASIPFLALRPAAI